LCEYCECILEGDEGDEGTKQTQTLSEREWNAFVRNEEFFSTDRQQTEKESVAMMREELDFNEKRDDRTRERKGWVSFQISF